MIKKVLLLITLLLIIAYLTVAITTLNSKPADQVCRQVELIIKDSINAGFITKNEILNILKNKRLYPIGKKIRDINSEILEKELSRHPLIEKTECYKTTNGNLCIEVIQRLPILRIMSEKGENYYIDNRGKIMPPEANCKAHLAIVTGSVEKSFAMNELYQFGKFLQNDRFWDAQIEQINVTSKKEIEIVPRVGDHIIFLGSLENFEKKLAKLRIFYEKALNQVGWNKYAKINMEFGNQIICIKKEK